MILRVCKKCKREKSVEDFHPHKLGKRHECKMCTNLRQRLNMYNLSVKDLEELVTAQNNKCAICGRVGKLCIDHNHNTGRIRGLLCHLCNTYLSVVEKDLCVLTKIKEYLNVME